MVKLTLGDKGQRIKHTVYALGILLLIIVGSCRVCRGIDWSAFQTREHRKQLLQLEEKILLQHLPPQRQFQSLMSQGGVWLRNRWMTGYLYNQATKEGYFIGRIASPDFRKAVEAQKPLLDAGKSLDKKKIPRLRLVMEFRSLNCLLLIGEPERPETTPPEK